MGRSWSAGRRGRTRPTREAIVFDIGLEPGGEDALRAVLDGWCAELAAEGVDRLVVGCGTGSPVHAVVAPLAVETKRYHLNCSWPPPPNDVPSMAFDHAVM